MVNDPKQSVEPVRETNDLPASVGGVLSAQAQFNLARLAEDGLAAAGYSPDAARAKREREEENAKKAADLAHTILENYEQFQQTATAFIDEQIAGLDEELKGLREQIAQRQQRQTEIQASSATLATALAAAEESAAATEENIDGLDTQIQQEAATQDTLESRISIQENVSQSMQDLAHAQSVKLPGNANLIVVKEGAITNADEGGVETLVVLDTETNQVVSTVADLPAQIRNEILHDVAGAQTVFSVETAQGELNAALINKDHERLAASTELSATLTTQKEFLRDQLRELRGEIKNIGAQLEALEAEGTANDAELARLAEEVKAKKELGAELRDLKGQVERGEISQEDFAESMETLGYGDEWRDQSAQAQAVAEAAPPVAPQETPGYDRALGTAAGSMESGGDTSTAFKAAALGVPVATPEQEPAFKPPAPAATAGVGGMSGGM